MKKLLHPKPFLKWAGGKTGIIKTLLKYVPKNFGNYFEPFLGGGALFFALASRLAANQQVAYLSDLNNELINTYNIVKHCPDPLINELKKYKNTEREYYAMRNNINYPCGEPYPIDRAARFIYFNKTCYNGLYRVNKYGNFNVPFGHYKNPNICDEETIRAASKILNSGLVRISNAPWNNVMEYALPNDFVYCDPPYVPESKTANFTEYNGGGFSIKEHENLATFFDYLASNDFFVMMSNSNTPWVRDRYKGYNQIEISTTHVISGKASSRKPKTELLIMNYLSKTKKEVNLLNARKVTRQFNIKIKKDA